MTARQPNSKIFKLQQPNPKKMSKDNLTHLQILSALHKKYSKSIKAPPLNELTTIVCCIGFVFEDKEDAGNQRREGSFREQLEDVLKCVVESREGLQCGADVGDRLELFQVLVRIVGKGQGRKGMSRLKELSIKLSMKIITPCLANLPQKTHLQTLHPLPLSLSLPYLQTLLIQTPKKFPPILLSHSTSILQHKTVTEIEAWFKEIFKCIAGCGEDSAMAVRVVQGVLMEYVGEFQRGYCRGRGVAGRFQPRVVGLVIKLIAELGSQVAFTRMDQDEPTVRQCNLCPSLSRPASTYTLQIPPNSYQIHLCETCTTTSSSSPETILLHLAYNSQPLPSTSTLHPLLTLLSQRHPQFHPPSLQLCQWNKELKLSRELLVGFVVREGLAGLWGSLWAVLMILANCDQVGVRVKAGKAIAELCAACACLAEQRHGSLLGNILKCLTNRLHDTDPRPRLQTTLTLLTLLPKVPTPTFLTLSTTLQSSIKTEPTLHTQLAKQVQELIDKIMAMLKDEGVREKFVQGDEDEEGDWGVEGFLGWIGVVVELAVLWETAGIRERENGSKSRKSRAKQQENEPSQAYKALSKHKQILTSYLKPSKSPFPAYPKLLTTLLNPSPPQQHSPSHSQKHYNTTIDILACLCGIDQRDSICADIVRQLCQGAVKGSRGLWVGCGRVLGWMLGVCQGFVWGIVEEIIRVCQCRQQEGDWFKISLNLCTTLTQILQTLPPQTLPSPSQPTLEQLRQLLLTQLIPEANTLPILQSQDCAGILYRLVGCIDLLAEDQGRYTGIVYGNCVRIGRELWEGLQLGEGEEKQKEKRESNMEKIKMLAQTIKLILGLLPQLTRTLQHFHSIAKFNSHIQDIFNYIHSILTYLCPSQSQPNPQSTPILNQYTYTLCTIWRLCPTFIPQCQSLLPSLLTHPSTSSALLQTLHQVLSTNNSLPLQQKIRDMLLFYMGRLDGQYRQLLGERYLYIVVVGLFRRGLLDCFGVGRVLLYGIVGVVGGEQQDRVREEIRGMCMEVVRELLDDYQDARQLLSNIGQTLKFILHNTPNPTLLTLPITPLLPIPTPSINFPTKPQQSQSTLKQTLLKSLCEHLTKLALSNKLLQPSRDTYLEVRLIYNTVVGCWRYGVRDYLAVLGCFMAVVDAGFFGVVRQDRGKGEGERQEGQGEEGVSAGEILWMVMDALAYLLNGLPFKTVNTDVEKHFKVKDGIIELKPREGKPNRYEGVSSLEYLHDRIICGQDSSSQDSNKQEQTWDNSQSRSSLKPKSKKTKQKSKPKPPTSKNTKKPLQRPKTAPKHSLANQFKPEPIEERELDIQVVEYKKKLRNRNKGVII